MPPAALWSACIDEEAKHLCVSFWSPRTAYSGIFYLLFTYAARRQLSDARVLAAHPGQGQGQGRRRRETRQGPQGEGLRGFDSEKEDCPTRHLRWRILSFAPNLASSKRSARGDSVRVHPSPNDIVVGPRSAILAPNHDLNDVTSAARGAARRNKSDKTLPPGRADSALPVGLSGGGVGARRDPRTTNCTAIIGNGCNDLAASGLTRLVLL